MKGRAAGGDRAGLAREMHRQGRELDTCLGHSRAHSNSLRRFGRTLCATLMRDTGCI